MKARLLPLAAALAAASLAGTALAQQQGQGPEAGRQILEQEKAAGSGTQLTISPATLRLVEQKLNTMGYQAGTVDGKWDEQIQKALANFQQAQGLEPTGQLNQRTLAALGVGQGGAAAGATGGAGGQR